MASTRRADPSLGVIGIFALVGAVSAVVETPKGLPSSEAYVPLGVNCCWVDGPTEGTAACVSQSTATTQKLHAKARLALGLKVNVNDADHAEIQLVRGVGPKLAHRIIEIRDQNGHFSRLDDLTGVPGWGKRRSELTAESLAVSDPPCHKMVLAVR